MDPLTQGLLGGALALSVANKKESRLAAAIGFVAALPADADILIGASDDPLLNIEFHRHFTHSLIFIPIGALIIASILWLLLRKRIGFKSVYFYALLGYGTSGLLDACTSYGTHLLWPFSDERIAWSIIAIIDPVFTLVLLIALILGFRYYKPGSARVGLTLAGAYLLLGLWQHQNALESARELAAQRGHDVQRILVKPTLANLILWRSVYRSGDVFYVDAIRIGPGTIRSYPGSTARMFVPERDLPKLPRDSVLARDIERFYRLSNDFVVPDPVRDNVLIDIRYSMLPTSVTPMWGIEFNLASPTHHAKFRIYRDRSEDMRETFVAMLLGRDLPE
ncbi:MAG: metal-dependent hydrolase [Gammaproteobacteria bacterium]|nr:metal-dependent hydrolase [Gammaproteobacteria bacterium]